MNFVSNLHAGKHGYVSIHLFSRSTVLLVDCIVHTLSHGLQAVECPMVVQASGDDMRAWRLRGCGQSSLDICGQTYDAFDAFNHVRHPDTLHRAMDFMNLWWLHYVPTFELSYFKLLFILSSGVLHVVDTTGASILLTLQVQVPLLTLTPRLIDMAVLEDSLTLPA